MQTVLLSMLIQSTLLLAAAALAQRFARNASSALRHLIWCSAMLCLLLLPPASWLLSHIHPPGPQWVVSVTESITVTSSGDSQISLTWTEITVLIWFAIALFLLLRLGIGTLDAFGMRSTATPVTDHDWNTLLNEFRPDITLLQSSRTATPLAFGHSIILPLDTANWTLEQRRAVLIHELAHINRYDVLTQWLASVACCFYWFHPLAWFAANRMRIEREQASDDAVLIAGVRGSDYASHLTAVARAMAGNETPGIAIPMATASTLEARLRAILANVEQRGRLTVRQRTIVALLTLTLIPSAAILRVDASVVSTFDGVVYDAVGRVPNAKLTLVQRATGKEATLRSDSIGAFHFSALPAGRYSLQVEAPGFKEALMPNLEIKPDQKQQYYPQLKVGSILEQVNVVAAPPGQIRQPAAIPARIRIGGNHQASRLIHKVNPPYPFEAKQAGIEGTVQLTSVITREGNLAEIHVIHSPNSALTKAAVNAVAEWRYTQLCSTENPSRWKPIS